MDFSDHPIGLSTSEVEGLSMAFSNAVSTERNLPEARTAATIPDSSDELLVDGVTPLVLGDDVEITASTDSSGQRLGIPGGLRLVSTRSWEETNAGVSTDSRNNDRSETGKDDNSDTSNTSDATSAHLSGGEVLSLFGEVSDEVFPAISANHPARSSQAAASNAAGLTSQVSPSDRPGDRSAARSARLLRATEHTTTTQSSQLPAAQTPDQALLIPSPEQSLLLIDRQSVPRAPARSRSFERRRPGSVGGVQTRVVPRSVEGTVDRETPNLRTNSSVQTPPNTTRPRKRSNPADPAFPNSGPDLVDLREAEEGQRATVRKSSGASINYFEGHDYVQRAQETKHTQEAKEVWIRSTARFSPSRFGAPGQVANSFKTPRQRRVPIGLRIQQRTGLSARAVTIVGLGVASLLGVGLVFSPLLSVHRVDIQRAGPATPRVRAAAQLRSGEALVSLDIAAVQRRLVALPEIAAAKVERVWPRGVRITVTTRTPVVALANEGRIALVSADGTVLRDLGSQGDAIAFTDDGITYQPIAVVELPPIGEKVSGASKRAVDLVAALDPDLRDRVGLIMMTGNDLTATISAAGKAKDLTVYFGDEHDLELKARALGTLLGAGSTTNVAGIDLTVPDAPVLRLTGTKAKVSTANEP